MKKMNWKSLGWLMMCLCALSFAACGDDGGDGNGGDGGGGSATDAKTKLVGTWTMEACSEQGAPVGSAFTFNSDGTGYSAAENTTFVYTYASDGSFSLSYANERVTITGKLIVSGEVASGTYSYPGSSTAHSVTFKKKTSGGNSESPTDAELSVNIQNLSGTWQAIRAKGTYDGGQAIDTKTLGGLDSLALPVLMVLNANQTFESYNPKWEYPHGADDNWPVYSWRKGDNKLPNGDGTVLIVGKQLQLIDSYRDEYALSMMIQSLTAKRLVVKYNFDGENCTVTYGRDGDGADYFSGSGGSSVEDKSKLVGTWTMASCSEDDAPVGNAFTFNSDGTGSYWNPYYNAYSTFTYTFSSDGSFTMRFSQGEHISGKLNVSGNSASGTYHYTYDPTTYTVTFRK